MVLLKNRIFFFADTAFNINPTAEQVAHIAIYTAQMARYFGVEPRIALLSYLNFSESAQENPFKMKKALKLVKKWKPELKVEGGGSGGYCCQWTDCQRYFSSLCF